MEERWKLQHDIQRYRSLLPLTTDAQAIPVLEELICETRRRLDELDTKIGEPEFCCRVLSKLAEAKRFLRSPNRSQAAK